MHTVIIPAPASKSLSHRVLTAAALAWGTSRLARVLESDDTARTREALSLLGAHFERGEEGEYTVQGIGGAVRGPESGSPLSIYVGESGTTCRLLTAVLAAGRGLFHIHGSGRMHERPLGELTRALSSLGADISFTGKPDCPPLLLKANGLSAARLAGNAVSISCDESSQYLSGLLLAAPLETGLDILLAGARPVSWPYVSLSLEILERFGISFNVLVLEQNGWQKCDWRALTEAVPGKLRFCVRPGRYQAGEHSVEGDWSGASYFLAAGAIGPKSVCVSGLSMHSLQGDAALTGILTAMGARVEHNAAGVTVHPGPLRGVELDMGNCPDLVPTVAALAAHACGTTRIRNAAHLSIKESNRLAAPAEELAKAGCAVTVTSDGLIIVPPAGGLRAPANGAVFSAHNDHRMAMSLSLLGLPGTQGGTGFAVPLDDPACVGKSFPNFWALWERLRS